MAGVTRQPVPADALHAKYARDGGHADCFVTHVGRAVSLEEFVEAFYTTWLFRLERFVLACLVFKPSTDAEARAFVRGERDRFAAWFLEDRAADQLLVHDFQDKTRSWFRVESVPGDFEHSRLYFGTGIKPIALSDGKRGLSLFFKLLMGFHLLYARALLGAARSRLERSRG